MSTPITYVVIHHVASEDLGQMLSAVDRIARLVSVAPTREAAQGTPPPRPVAQRASVATRPSRFRGGTRFKGVRGEDLVLQVLEARRGRVVSLSEIQNEFKANNFAEHSCSGAIHKLVSENKIVRVDIGKYSLPGTYVSIGDVNLSTALPVTEPQT